MGHRTNATSKIRGQGRVFLAADINTGNHLTLHSAVKCVYLGSIEGKSTYAKNPSISTIRKNDATISW